MGLYSIGISYALHNFREMVLNRVKPPFHQEKPGSRELYSSLFPSILLLIFAPGLLPLDY